MKVLMTGGGTAGHITPILSVATELKILSTDIELRYVCQKGDKLNSLVVDSHDFEKIYAIFAGKWRRYHSIGFWAHLKDPITIIKNVRDSFLFALGFIQSIWILIFWRPNVIFVKGGYVGLPVGLAAALLRIKIITHDSDAMPGLTNRILARYTYKQCVALPKQYYKQYKQSKIIQTGIPISDNYQIYDQQQINKIKSKLGLPSSSKVLTVFGGSLGAVRLNNSILKIAKKLLFKNPDLYLLHITGNHQSKEISEFYAGLATDIKARVRYWGFLSNLYEITGIADLVISRAGATSIAELSAQKKAIVLVPNPLLTGGHQLYNAEIVEASDAAIVVNEKELAKDNYNFDDVIGELLNDNNRLKLLADNLSQLTVVNAAKNIANVIIEVAK